MSHQFSLMKQRRFLPFFLTQFLGAFNDNVYKNALVVLLTYHAISYTALEPGILVNLCAGLFILPFFLFSATAGQIADKFEKSRLIRFTKLLEIVIMMLACAAFMLKSLPMMLGALFLLGTQSALFGPVKYAILPQQLHESELVGGNALVESGTFLAILLGTITGGLLVPLEYGTDLIAAVGMVIAILGYLTSRAIPESSAASPDLKINWNPLTETWRNLSFTRSNRAVFLAILGISWFWFYGAIFLSQFPAYAKDSLGGNEHSVTLLLAIFSVGIGFGSLLCERLSGGRVELGLVPFGSIGLSLFALDLWWSSPVATSGELLPLADVLAQPGSWRALIDLVGIGVFGGFYIVPLYALIQTRSEPSHRSRIIAGNNIINALFMVVAAGMGAGLIAAGFSVPQIFLITGLLNIAIAIYIYLLLPEFLMRFIAWLMIHSIYRLDVKGVEQVPEKGPALLLCNRVSPVDALIVMTVSRRPMRFVMEQRAFDRPILGRLLRRCHAIPKTGNSEATQEQILSALAKGELVVMFRDGTQISHNDESSPYLTALMVQSGAPGFLMTLQGCQNGKTTGIPVEKLRSKRTLFSHISLDCQPLQLKSF